MNLKIKIVLNMISNDTFKDEQKKIIIFKIEKTIESIILFFDRERDKVRIKICNY